MLRRIVQFCFLIVTLALSAAAHAGNPAPLFDKPVKVDDSGRPMYNSWERYEDQRQKRYQQRVQAKKKQQKQPTVVTNAVVPQQNSTAQDQKVGSTDNQGSGQSQSVKIQNGATTSPTPSSVIINRPVQTQGDPEVDLNNFDF